ncbi:hypothetical protein CROQUDRAFT_84823 [Cronartium quercuum f. sp. fusiforme G11]|uniref:Cofilin n=1 Tax=Cronartium quercuum f. sp. fusiforme G11 TaxID=708437 RepID=A0A9P6T5K9_9BASI|nr:hypothetical protein CROQUDRAFT_84823 [Cronartium quercuum f. sp. fusiforme G11]
MASGVAVNQACVDEYLNLKLKKKNTYIIFVLSDDSTEIKVEKTSESPSYEDFVADLPETACRYAIYDFAYDLGEGKRNKLCFYAWSPDNAKIKNKMLYASSKDALRRALVGIAVEVQGTDYSEVSYESVLEKATRK